MQDHDGVVVLVVGAVDRAGEVILSDGIDVVRELHRQNAGRVGRRRCSGEHQSEKDQAIALARRHARPDHA